jgi:hypothetical protein
MAKRQRGDEGVLPFCLHLGPPPVGGWLECTNGSGATIILALPRLNA